MSTAASIVVVLLGCMLVSAVQRRRPAAETRVAWIGYLGHVLGAGAQYLITAYWYGGGDMFLYHRTGLELDRLLDYDFGQYGVQLIRIFFQDSDVLLPVTVIGIGSSTGTMAAVSAALLYPLGGSLVAACLVLSTAAFLSRIILLRVFLRELPAENHRSVALVLLLLPSVTFWGAALAKETLVLIGLGPLALAAHELTSRGSPMQRAALLVLGFVAGGLIWLVKPYILIGFATAGVVWWYTRLLNRTGRKITRTQLVFGSIMVVGAIVGVGQVLPTYSVDAVAERAAHLQELGGVIEGGSNYELGGVGGRTGMAQLAFVPLALASALFRPLLIEVRNPLMLLNALETTWVLYLVLSNLSLGRIGGLISATRESPVIAFSLAFVLVVAVGVGLTSMNLGTLTRYRMPMMPFYGAFLVVWRERLKARPPAVRPPVFEPRRPRPQVRAA